MKKSILILGFGILLVGCSGKSGTKVQSTNNQNVAPPPSISCKDYCKNECQGMQASCETNCLSACYPPPGASNNLDQNQNQNASK